MAESAESIIIAANATVSTAPYSGSLAFPTSPTASLDAAYSDVGFVSEEGASFTDSQSTDDIRVWQSFYPVRTFVTEKTSSLEFVCKQFDPESVGLALGGGTVTVTGTAPNEIATYVPPAPEDIDYRSLVLTWEDGGNDFRLVFPRGIVNGDVSVNLARSGSADLPIAYKATPLGAPDANEESNAFYLLTNHPNWTD